MAFQYDLQERLSRVTSGTNMCRYAYDGDGTRTKRLDAEGTVHYASDLERNVGAGDGNVVVTRYYYAPLGARRLLVAFRKAGVLYWAGTDHLGGTVRTLDAGFNVVDSSRYVAFGADRDPATALKTDRKFTGQTQDKVSGLYFYKSRYYDQALGRFVQPDSVVPSPKNPQSLNRYSYALNNPVTFSDPSGLSAEGWDHGSYDSWGESDYESSGPNDPGYTQSESWETGGGYDSGSGTSQEEQRFQEANRDVGYTEPQSGGEASAGAPGYTQGETWSPESGHTGHDSYGSGSGAAAAASSQPAGPSSYGFVERDRAGMARVVTVRQNVGWPKDLMLGLLGAEATVLYPEEIWARGALPYSDDPDQARWSLGRRSKLVRHEVEHVQQMRERGHARYLAEYLYGMVPALVAARGDLNRAHDFHAMEVDANQRAGLPDAWRIGE